MARLPCGFWVAGMHPFISPNPYHAQNVLILCKYPYSLTKIILYKVDLKKTRIRKILLNIGTSEAGTRWHTFKMNFKRTAGPYLHHL
jgi:hypothetical protein